MMPASDHRDGPLGAEALEDVLAAARSNAPWAFERLYREFAPRVAGYLRMLGADEPEDLTNETLLGVFKGLPTFNGDVDDLRSWVFTIAHRRLIDAHRRRSARPATTPLRPATHDAPAGDVETEAMRAIGSADVLRLLGCLTDAQREVILLRVVADLSVEQVAEISGKRPGAVKMLQRRGLATLRRVIAQEGVTS
jgi:RNA polymerase sigma factor (sigma-70 family)